MGRVSASLLVALFMVFTAHDLAADSSGNQPRQPASGEAKEGTVLYPSTTVWGVGDLKAEEGGSQHQNMTEMMGTFWNDDVHVRSANLSNKELHQSMACDLAGNLYVAWEDDTGYIQLYSSDDNGETWDAFAYIVNPDAYLREPSITVGQGKTQRLLVTYIADSYLGKAVPEVATSKLNVPSFTIHSVPVWGHWEDYAKPVIWTDTSSFFIWYAYLTCEGIYDSASQNINICAWSSTDSGATWGNETVVMGLTDTDAWIDPDGAFGTTKDRLFVSCYNDTEDTIYTVTSDDSGVTYTPAIPVSAVTGEPTSYRVDPEIEAAVDNDNVLLCATIKDFSHDIAESCSNDAGATWSPLSRLECCAEYLGDFAPALCAGESGKSFHLAFSGNYGIDAFFIMYNKRPQDLGEGWKSEADHVSDFGYGSGAYSKKGITSNKITDACGIAWADYRDGYPDYDTYFDYSGYRTLHVPAEHATIQAAIDAAPEDWTVLVDPGTYPENIDFKGKALTVVSKEGADTTIIDGTQTDTVVTFSNGEEEDSLLQGFTITNGKGYKGGGIDCTGASPKIMNCVIWNNHSTYLGGGAYCNLSNAMFSHVTIYGNTAVHSGGGIFCCYTNSSQLNLKNSIIWNNSPSQVKEGIGGEVAVKFCDMQGGWPGTGKYNIDEEPRFVDAAGGDFHLTWRSPCINRGTILNAGEPDFDFEGDPRSFMGNADIGADEFTGNHSLETDQFFVYEGFPVPVNFTLKAGKNNPNRSYFLVGSLSGSNPGTALPGGAARLPLNWDVFTDIVLTLLNTATFDKFMGHTNSIGVAKATMNAPALPGAAGLNLYFAYALSSPWDFASNPIRIEVLP